MNPEEMIREAQARGLTRNPTLILDAAPGESPAETIARMQRATEFVSASDETANLKAQLQTLQGRIESLERRIEKMTEREQAVRRAVGQLAHACDVIRK